jgi:transitional endoplasmic reticulum ATPase
MAVQKTMAAQKVASMLASAQKSETLWSAVLVFLGAFFLLATIPFYPVYLVPVLALACGLLATKLPPAGLILGALLGFFAVLFQSSVLGWFYLLIFAIVLFEAFENWKIVAVLEILILAPFAFSGFPLIGWITILGMAIGSLYFGSKKSVMISLPSVFMILFLSSMWLAQNTAYMPIKLEAYGSGRNELLLSKAPVGIGEIIGGITGTIGDFLSPDNFGRIGESIGWLAGNVMIMAGADSLILQLIGWGAALYLLGYLPSKIKQRPQLISSLSLLIPVLTYFLISGIYGSRFQVEFLGGITFAILGLGALEHFGISISRESEIQRRDKMKAYGKFGMADMSLGGSEKGMADVGGYDDVKQELSDAIMLPLDKKEIAYTYGIKPPAGILLFGPPGTGKTMLMRALAKELKYNFIEVKCSQILSQWYGESEKNVAEVFDNARKNAPTVLFFDEIDGIAKKRSSESLDEVGPRVLSELLQQIDGASKTKATVMVVGATNLPNELDPALLRPGRLDKIIYMHLPDPKARLKIFQVHLRNLPLADDLDYELLVRKTERFSGADIKNIVTEAKRLAAVEASKKGVVIPLSMAHFTRILANVKPSTSLAQLDIYEQFRLDFERRTGGEKAEKEESEKERTIRWEDVAGLDRVKNALLEAIQLPLLHEKEMKEFGVSPSKGILLFGPPGTGKTLIVRAAASELKASFQSLSGAEIMKKGFTRAVGVIKETFNRARENTPAIIFVDEMETFAPARGMGGSSEIIGQFLTEMDGIKGKGGVVVIAATNKPQLMDAAILRPGRFDKIFYVPPPDEKGRAEIFGIHLGKFAQTVDLKLLAAMTPGFTGADIASVCQSAKMEALRSSISGQKNPVSTEMLVHVLQSRRPSVTAQLLQEYKRFLEAYGERK